MTELPQGNVYINERSIMLSGGVTEESVGIIMSTIIKINHEDSIKEELYNDYVREPIDLYLNTCGGFTYDSLGLADIMMTSITPVYTFAMGKCMSAGLTIFLAGQGRYCTKNTTFMYHCLSHTINGQYGKLIEDLEEDTRLQGVIEEFVSSRCKITPKMLQSCRDKKTDLYIDAATALKLGIVDSVIGGVKSNKKG